MNEGTEAPAAPKLDVSRKDVERLANFVATEYPDQTFLDDLADRLNRYLNALEAKP